jgi:hypothetical protein
MPVGGDGDPRTLQVAAEGRDGGERWCQHDLPVGRQVGDQRAKGGGKHPRLGAGHVHLPVASDHGLAHRDTSHLICRKT